MNFHSLDTILSSEKTNDMMTEEEIRDLVGCYIDVEGYDDLRSILSVMSQEYPQEFDRKLAIQIIRETLRAKSDESKRR